MSEEPRRGVHESASVTISDFNAALQGRYVSPSDAVGYRVLDPTRARLAEAVVDTLVPGDDAWPSASDTGAAEYLDASAFVSPGLRPLLLRALDAVAVATQSQIPRPARTQSARPQEQAPGLSPQSDMSETALGRAGFAGLDSEQREQVLAELEAKDPSGFQLLLELTLEAYYRSGLVRRPLLERAGYRSDVAKDGVSIPPFDLTLLEHVGELPPKGALLASFVDGTQSEAEL